VPAHDRHTAALAGTRRLDYCHDSVRLEPLRANDMGNRFDELKQLRRIATRCDKLGATFFAFIQPASVRVVWRSNESTA